MKIAFVGDLHIGARNGNPVILEMMRDFFSQELFPLLLEKDIKAVIQLGDVLDKRKNIDFTVSSYLVNVFYNFFETNDIQFFSTIGNHDIYYRQSISLDGPSQFSSGKKNIHIIKDCTTVNLGEKDFVLVPWICDENKESVVDYIRSNSSKKKILCGHFELSGFPMQKGFISEKGTIDSSYLKNYRTTISGHYHCPSDRGNICYIGTPYELTWSDYGDNKRILIYDTETDEFETVYTKKKLFHKIMYHDNILKSIDFNEYKRSFIKVVLNDDYNEGKLNVFLTMLDENSNPYSIQTIDCRENDASNIDEVSFEDVHNPIEIMMSTIENKIQDETMCALTKELAYKIYQESLEKMQ